MDPKLLYWTGALANLAVIVACGALGVRAVRRGDVRSHRARMLTCTALIGLFLLSYPVKVALLGREDRSAWRALDLALLYAHELCIAVMLVAGALALARARRFRGHLGNARPAAEAPLPGRRAHRRAGWSAALAALLAFATAIAVWAGMLARAGLV